MVRGQPAARELVPVVLEEWQSAAVLSRVPVAAPARRFAGRRVGALTPASAGYGKIFSTPERKRNSFIQTSGTEACVWATCQSADTSR